MGYLGEHFGVKKIWFLIIAGSLLFAPLIPYKIPTSEWRHCGDARAASHWLYRWVPRHRTQIHWYDGSHWLLWGLFGNDDDGLFGEGPGARYRPDHAPSFTKALRWTLRNPLHNFTFYLIGTAWKSPTDEFTLLQISQHNSRVLEYEEHAHTVFAGEGSSLFLGLHSGRPFISCRLDCLRRFEFYWGWRERGNFGLKFALGRKIPSVVPPEPLVTADPAGRMADHSKG